MGSDSDAKRPGLQLVAAGAIRNILQGNAEEIEQLVRHQMDRQLSRKPR